MRLLLNSFITLSSFILLTGCSTKIDLNEYKDVSSVNTIEEVQSKYTYKPLTLSKNNVEVNGNNSYKDYFSNSKNTLLSFSYQRNFFKPTKEKSTHKMSLSIDTLDTQREYIPSRYIKTKDGGYYTRAYYAYDVFSSLSLELIDENGISNYFTAQGSTRFTHYSRINTPKKYYIDAISYAIWSLTSKIANSITPRATIISKKINIDDDDEYIFLINMGKNQGVYSQQSAKVYKETIEKNQVKAITMKSNVFIDKAIVSNQVMANSAWIVLDEEDNNPLINIGDTVELNF